MAKVKVYTAAAFEGPAIQYTGDDGYPVGYILPVVTATDYNGNLYQLPNSFKVCYDDEGWQQIKVKFDITKARDIRAQILDRGYIETEHWVSLTKEDLNDYLRQSYHG